MHTLKLFLRQAVFVVAIIGRPAIFQSSAAQTDTGALAEIRGGDTKMDKVSTFKALEAEVAKLEAAMWRTKSKFDTDAFSKAFCELGDMRRQLAADGIDVTNPHALPDRHIIARDRAIEQKQDGDA